MNDEEKYNYILNFIKEKYFGSDNRHVMVGHDSHGKYALFVRTKPVCFVVGKINPDKTKYSVHAEIHSVNDLILLTSREYLNFMYGQIYGLVHNIRPIEIDESDLEKVFEL